MREAFYGIATDYVAFFGTSKIVLLFLLSMVSLVLINDNKSEKDERRLINPAVFLLSLWSATSYAAVSLLSSKKRGTYIAGLLIFITMFSLCGQFVISEQAYKSSIYYSSPNLITILSVVCILFFFIIYYLISRQLFYKRLDRMMFMIFVLVLHLFGFYSEKSAVISMFLSPITVQSIIVHDVMPLALWIYLVFEDSIKKLLEVEEDTVVSLEADEIPEEWDMKKHKILNIRNMAIAFIVMIAVFVASIFVLNKKINSLYDATVLLENAANTKMTVYEMKEADGSVALTLMISPDGNVTALGGGDASNGTESFDFINRHAESVDVWYLYGDSEKDKGAYDFCVEQGLNVKETFVVSGIEKIEE